MTAPDDSQNGPGRLAPLVQPVSSTWYGQVLEGVSTSWVGLRVLWLRPRLWWYAFWPVLLNLLITAAVFFAVVAVVVAVAGLLHPWMSQSWTGWWWYVFVSLEVLAVLVLLVLCIGVAMLVWRLLSGMLCGYFYGLLATQVELELGTPKSELSELAIWTDLKDTLRAFFWLAIVLAISLAFSLVPFVGPPVALGYSIYYQLLSCGRDYFSFPLALRGLDRRQRLEFTNRHHTHTLGLGMVVFAFEFIPIIGALMMVTAAAGGVVLHHRLALADAEAAKQ